MASTRFVATTGSNVQVTTTTKLVLAAIAASARALTPTELSISFAGTTTTDAPILVELVQSDGTTAGTGTTVAPIQVGGQVAAAAGATANKDYTTQPTVLSAIREWQITPAGGLFVIQYPLGREPEPSDSGRLLGLRVTVPSGGPNVNCRAYIEWEE